MTRICIVGAGLIGGSLGRSLRKVMRGGHRVFHVSGLGRKKSELLRAKKMGAVDEYALHPKKILPQADIVILCLPVQYIVPTIQKILPYLKPNVIVSDTGSVKQEIEKKVRAVSKRRPDLQFVGAHPLAGSEKSGVQNSTDHMFRGAPVVLVGNQASFKSMDKIKYLWTSVGAKCFLLNAKEHDQILALTSHLPHLMAYSLFRLALDQANKNSIVKSLVAGSFRDMTRIAASDPELWAGIIQMNRKALKQNAQKLIIQIKKILALPAGKISPSWRYVSKMKKNWD